MLPQGDEKTGSGAGFAAWVVPGAALAPSGDEILDGLADSRVSGSGRAGATGR
jgi:hypothetical protein